MLVPPRSFGPATVLGYPRIGPRRELKRALESYWAGESSASDLRGTGRALREAAWRRLDALGLDAPPSNTFSLYDHVLDTAVMLNAVPDRYRALESELDAYFAMARGTGELAPLRMTKWFDTNYHYIVPEIGASTTFRLADSKPADEFAESRAIGINARPVLLGPVTFLLLAEAAPGGPAGFSPLDRLPDVLDVYARLLADLAAEGAEWVQVDEPALVADRTEKELAAVRDAYERLGGLPERPGLFVASYFGDLGEALPVLAATPVEAIGIDLTRGAVPPAGTLTGKILVAGVVSGRSVWRTDLPAALDHLRFLRGRAAELVVSTSSSLLHVPYDVELETNLDPGLASRLAFADQKVGEVIELAERLAAAPDRSGPPISTARPAPAAPSFIDGRRPYSERAVAQQERLRLPATPTTTIGSFPQTDAVRLARADFTRGRTDRRRYEELIKAEIERAIRLQERLDLDVLVHGEPERNDMVQYFAEHLDGFATTRYGWVQSYGSRCTRPPILHGDVRRAAPITLDWTSYAQSLTDRPVKGMLTGPVTIVAWSFVRDDLPLPNIVQEVAQAVREEVADLEASGISIIQVDEPALRELLPLRRERQAEYLDWAVAAYRHATSGAADHTQIHTHLCYSNAAEVIAAIDALDADVTSIESARSDGRILAEPAVAEFARGLGPGVYDIHSPRVPGTDEIAGHLKAITRALPAERIWVNPDCGLKTRGYDQVEAALANMVAAARAVRPQPEPPSKP